jgi:DNA-binding transcriptional regulator GbsR (MarR family)
MRELTITQKQVLKVLYDNRDTWLTATQISKIGNINRNHVVQAVRKFMDWDYVYQPTRNDEVKISLDGVDAYINMC